MGVGTPQNILEAIERGVDMFDCVMPTRNGRNAMLFTYQGTMNMRNKNFTRQVVAFESQYIDKKKGRLRPPHLPADRTRHLRLHPRLQRLHAAGLVLRPRTLLQGSMTRSLEGRRTSSSTPKPNAGPLPLHQTRIRLAGHGAFRAVPQPRHAHQPRSDGAGRDRRLHPDDLGTSRSSTNSSRSSAKGSTRSTSSRSARHVHYAYPFSTFILTLIGVANLPRARCAAGQFPHRHRHGSLFLGHPLQPLLRGVRLSGTLPTGLSM